MIKNWNPDKLKQAVVKKLIENAEAVGEFVKSEAQKNLLAIEEPRWGRRYRASLAYRHLAFEVEQSAREITITVGAEAYWGSRHHGFYIETGSRTQPAQPWLRPAVFGNGRQIVELLTR